MERSGGKEEFVKSAGFVLMATVSIHDKNTGDIGFIKFLPIIKNNSTDNRNLVKKVVNWALGQIGKRNCILNKKAIETANEILQINSKHVKWIVSDAIRDLTNPATQDRVNNIKKEFDKNFDNVMLILYYLEEFTKPYCCKICSQDATFHFLMNCPLLHVWTI